MGMALWALLLVPGLSQALGLGEIEVNSALNQPLNAEIELISVRPGEMQDLQVRIAPEALYRRLGIERTAIITELRFAPTTLPDGRHVIRVTTSNPVREPFVNFLVEATWPAGRLVREYTLLLDPPVLFEQRTEPAPRAPVSAAPREARPTPAAPRPAAPAPRATLDTYRVQRGDMLWNVARDLRPDASVSVEQMMLALLRANPEAFTDNNINNLQSGRVLRVPDMAEISRLNQAEARTEVARQNALWQEYRTRVAAAPQPQVPALPGTEAPVAPRTEAVPAPAEQDARLEILAARDADEARAEVERELALAREVAEARSREAAELRSRVAELESLLSRSERLLELNNAQMAELQARLDELEGREPAGPAEAAEAPAVVAPEEPPVVAEAEPAPVEPAVEAEPAVPGEPVTLSEAERMAAEAPAVEAAPEPQVAAAPAPAAPAPAPAAPAQPRPTSLVDEIMASPNLMMIAGLVVLLVLLLIWLMIKRLGKGKRAAAASPASTRSEPALSSGEGALAAAAAGGALAGAAALAAGRGEAEGQEVEPSETAEAAAESEEAEAPAGGLESEEIINDDTIAEVDVYLAYGLYSQAEDLLNKAIQEHPDRVDYRFKLAETHYANRNVEAFEANAQAMHDTLAGRPSQLWERVQSMGQDLNPANPLFSGALAMDFGAGGEAGAPEVDLDLGVQDLEGSLDDLDLGEEPPAKPEAAETEAPAEIELDLDVEEKPTASAEESLEFDLGDLDLGGEGLDTELLDTTAVADEQEPAPAKPLDVSGELEESLEIGGLDEDLGAGLEDELAAAFDLETETPAVERPVSIDTAEDDTQIMEEDFSEIDFLGEGTEDELLVSDEEEQALPSGDEVSTKLDLARAYIDMGDSEGARSTLEEVLAEGNATQKQEAQGLLDQLS